VFRSATPLIVRGRGGGLSDFKGSQFERDMMRWGVRWSGVSPLSSRQGEELRPERGGAGEQATLKRWGIK
jgi:transposase-like protein